MRKSKLLLIGLILYPIQFASNTIIIDVVKPKVPLETNDLTTNNTLDLLINAMIWVESKGDSLAIGDTQLKTPSVGVLQIRPIMVNEVNRILRLKKDKRRFALNDRFSKAKSIEMFRIWQQHHHLDSSFEKIARSWNGGNVGSKNTITSHYWDKVKSKLDKK